MKEIPILFEKKEERCGCAACEAVCPSEAIKLEADEEGFDYPYIDAEKCTGCKVCLSACPLK